MKTIMFRLKAMPLAASASVPMRPTITMKMAKARISSEYWRPVGRPKRRKRTKSPGSKPPAARACANASRCAALRIIAR